MTLTASFDGRGSTDDRTIVWYEWDFGDGDVAFGPTDTHGYPLAGNYTATLTVTADDGLTDTIVVSLPAGGGEPIDYAAYWKFDEGWGATAFDSSGNG